MNKEEWIDSVIDKVDYLPNYAATRKLVLFLLAEVYELKQTVKELKEKENAEH